MGFEPTDARTSPVFKTGSFDRSDISPQPTNYIIHDFCYFVNPFFDFYKKTFSIFFENFFDLENIHKKKTPLTNVFLGR